MLVELKTSRYGQKQLEGEGKSKEKGLNKQSLNARIKAKSAKEKGAGSFKADIGALAVF